MKNLLLLTTYSKRENRIESFIKHLPEYGWKVHLISKETAPCPVCPHNLPKGKGKINNILKWLCIPDLDITWLPVAEKKAKNVETEIIISSVPPFSTILLGTKLSKKLKVPHITDYRDPWIFNQLRYTPTRLHYKITKKLELHLDQESNAIIQVTEKHRERYLEHFPQIQPEKVHTIPNGYDPEDYQNINYRKNDKFTIAYIGTLLPNYDISFLKDIQTFYQIHPEAKSKTRVVFAGKISTTKAREISKYKFAENLGFLPRQKAIDLTANADLLIFSLSPEPQYDIVISSRIYEYIAIGKRIMAITHPNSLPAQLIQETNSGTIIPHGDHETILRELTALWTKWKNGADIKKKKNLATLEQYQWKKLTGKLAHILDTL